MKTLEFSTEVNGVVERVVFSGAENIDAVLFLLENSSLHFLPEAIGDKITTMISFVVADQPAVVCLYSRHVGKLFDVLSKGMVSPLQELRYNTTSAVTDNEESKPHEAYYAANMKALYLQSRLLPVVITALLNNTALDMGYAR